jgi:hypothetical protein
VSVAPPVAKYSQDWLLTTNNPDPDPEREKRERTCIHNLTRRVLRVGLSDRIAIKISYNDYIKRSREREKRE